MRKLKIRWKNARAAVRQLKAGEWEFKFNPMSNCCCTAQRGENEMWVTNGPFFCDVNEHNAFGLILRHYVWWAGVVRILVRENKARLAKADKTPILYDE